MEVASALSVVDSDDKSVCVIVSGVKGMVEGDKTPSCVLSNLLSEVAMVALSILVVIVLLILLLPLSSVLPLSDVEPVVNS